MRRIVLGVCVCALALVLTSRDARAQQQPPPRRFVTVTSFEVPFGPDRGKVMSFLNEYFIPGIQLDPGVRNFRLLTHLWGSDGMQVIMVSEYDNWADIEADCGQPCDDYYAQHEAPEEGEEGYAEYQEMANLFSKYYSGHRDEIYSTNMNRAVVDGQKPAWVGPAPPAPEDDD